MINLGLSRTQRLLDHIAKEILHQPKFEPSWKAVHIAGTNGKGSVAAYLAAYLRLALRKNGRGNQRIGRFTSPHFIDRWDCIHINNEPVSQRLFEATEHRVRRLALQVTHELENESLKKAEYVNAEAQAQIRKDSEPTEFEILTATAFTIFSIEPDEVEFAIIECGLGGRLDATNALPSSAIATSVITRIGLDHVDMLGGSLETIVREKCGIFRQNVPIIFDGLNVEKVRALIEGEIRLRYGLQEGNLVESITMSLQNLVYKVITFDVSENATITSQAEILKSNSESAASDPRSHQTGRHVGSVQRSPDNPLHGALRLMPHQLTNLGVAFQAADVAVRTRSREGFDMITRTPEMLDDIISVANKSYPARLQFMEAGWLDLCPTHQLELLNTCHVLLDGAHNAQSAGVLREFVQKTITEESCPVVFVMGLSRGGDRNKVFETVFGSSAVFESETGSDSQAEEVRSRVTTLGDCRIFGTGFGPVPGMPWVKPRDRREIEDTFEILGLGDRAEYSSDNIVGALEEVEDHVRRFHVGSDKQKPLLVIAGSLYLASDFLRFLRDGKSKYLKWFNQN